MSSVETGTKTAHRRRCMEKNESANNTHTRRKKYEQAAPIAFLTPLTKCL